jgi:hypothetical protein
VQAVGLGPADDTAVAGNQRRSTGTLDNGHKLFGVFLEAAVIKTVLRQNDGGDIAALQRIGNDPGPFVGIGDIGHNKDKTAAVFGFGHEVFPSAAVFPALWRIRTRFE